MTHITVRAHFDGTHILLDDPIQLQPNTQLLVTIMQPINVEDQAWHGLSMQGLAAAYSDDEPEYPLTSLKEHNADYE